MRALGRVRLPLPGTSAVTSHYILAGVLLTLVWLLVRGLAPAGGLTRSFHYPLSPAANPLRLDIARVPVAEERAADVELAFLDELPWPARHYFVRWRGVWFSPRAERIALWAGADDGVVVRIDGENVIERHPAVGMHTETRSDALEAGPHMLEIDHWQRGGGRSLHVRWAPAGGEPRALTGLLTGIPWRNKVPFQRYLRRDPSIFDALGHRGYRLRSLTSYGPRHGGIGRISGVESAVRYTIPAPYGSYREYVDSASAQLLDLSLFRHAPHDLKAGVYRDGQWLLQAGTATRQGAAPKRAFGDAMFLQDFGLPTPRPRSWTSRSRCSTWPVFRTRSGLVRRSSRSTRCSAASARTHTIRGASS